MCERMSFPATWEEYEKQYGITDTEEVYTNGARLIPSIRVKQWLDHLAVLQTGCDKCAMNGSGSKYCDNCKYKRQTGEWLEKTVCNDEDNGIDAWQSARCSKCGKYHTTPYMYYFNDYEFCPNCGARMESEQNE